MKAWGDAPPSTQTDMAIHHFVSGLWDGATRDALRQQRTLFNLTWPEVIRFAQSREADPATQRTSVVDAPRSAPQGAAGDSNESRAPETRNNWRENPSESNQQQSWRDRSWNGPRDGNKSANFQRGRGSGSSWRGPRGSYSQNRGSRKGNRSSWGQNRGNYGRNFGGERAPTPGPSGRTQQTNSIQESKVARNEVTVLRHTDLASAGSPAQENYQVSCPVTIQGTEIEGCLADTGSCRTILSFDVYRELENQPRIRPWPRSEKLFGVGGGELWPMGTAILEFELGPHILYHPVVISKGIDYPMIIGVDVLRQHEVQINLGHPDHIHVSLDDCPVCLEHGPSKERTRESKVRLDLNATEIGQDSQVSPVATTKADVVIGPRSCLLTEFRITGELPVGTELLAEPKTGTLERYMIACLPAVVQVERDQVVRLVLVKPSNTKRKVPIGASVASLVAVTTSQEVHAVSQRPSAKLSKKEKLQKGSVGTCHREDGRRTRREGQSCSPSGEISRSIRGARLGRRQNRISFPRDRRARARAPKTAP